MTVPADKTPPRVFRLMFSMKSPSLQEEGWCNIYQTYRLINSLPCYWAEAGNGYSSLSRDKKSDDQISSNDLLMKTKRAKGVCVHIDRFRQFPSSQTCRNWRHWYENKALNTWARNAQSCSQKTWEKAFCRITRDLNTSLCFC